MDWTGSVFARGGRLYLKVKDLTGRWVQRATGLPVGEEARAQKLLVQVRIAQRAGQELEPSGPVTVAAYARNWLEKRPDTLRATDRGRYELWVRPVLGDLRLDEVRPRHLLAMLKRAEDAGKASRTRRHTYSLVQAMFRDAVIDDLLDVSPCILRKSHLPASEDARHGWRAAAIFTRDELAALVYAETVPDRDQVAYDLLGLAGLRHGEMAGVRWRSYDPTPAPLGRLTISTSYARGRTKTGPERWVPVHPALAAALAQWKLSGWARLMGRAPLPDDLICPADGEGTMRAKHITWWRFDRVQKRLGWRHRRVHDLRRTFITLAREDGADPSILRLVTHAPPRDVMSLYTSLGWTKLCEQVSCLKIPSPRSASNGRGKQ